MIVLLRLCIIGIVITFEQIIVECETEVCEGII